MKFSLLLLGLVGWSLSAAASTPDCTNLSKINGKYSLYDQTGKSLADLGQMDSMTVYATGCQLSGLSADNQVLYFDLQNNVAPDGVSVIKAEILQHTNPSATLEFRVQRTNMATNTITSRALFRLLQSGDLIIVTDIYDKKGSLLNHNVVIGRKTN